MTQQIFPLDTSGTSPMNLVVGELITLPNSPNGNRCAAPQYGAFYANSLVIFDTVTNLIVPKSSYNIILLMQDATINYGSPINLAIVITNPSVSSVIRINVQYLGGGYSAPASVISQLANLLISQENSAIDWNTAIINKPTSYNPAPTNVSLDQVKGWESIIGELERLAMAVDLSGAPMYEQMVDWVYGQIQTIDAQLIAMQKQITDAGLLDLATINQDMAIEQARAGLAEASNANAISVETQARLLAEAVLVNKCTTINGHSLQSNIVLSYLDVGAISSNLLGTAGTGIYGSGGTYGVAPLDNTGKVPVSFLPSSNVTGGMTYAGLWNPTTNTPTLTNGIGVTGTTYIVTTTAGPSAPTTTLEGNNTYVAGNLLIFGPVFISGVSYNKWTVVGSTSTTVNSIAGLTGVVTLANLGLNLVNNTSDLNKPVSTATTTAILVETNARIAADNLRVTSVSATGVLSSTGGVTPNISITQATTSQDGYLSHADWNTFNNKQAALGFTPYNASNPNAFISGITSTMVVSALNFTPYNASNPNGYQTSSGSVNYATNAGYVPWSGVQNAPTNLNQFTNGPGYITGISSSTIASALGFAPYNSNNPNGFITAAGSCVNSTNANYATTAGNANKLIGMNWNWTGAGGQPSWLWGGNDGANMYVYNPSNFSVNYATTAGSAGSATNANNATTASNVNGQSFSWSNNSNNPNYLWGTNSNGSSFIVNPQGMNVSYANNAAYAAAAGNAQNANNATNATTANNALAVNGQSFSYSNTSNSPTYLWGTNNYGSSFLAATSNLSVGNATTASNVNGQSFSWSNPTNGPNWLWGTNSNGSSFLVNPQGMNVSYANNAAYAAAAGTMSWTGLIGNPPNISTFPNNQEYINESNCGYATIVTVWGSYTSVSASAFSLVDGADYYFDVNWSYNYSYYYGRTSNFKGTMGNIQSPSGWFTQSSGQGYLQTSQGIFGSYGEYTAIYFYNAGIGQAKYYRVYTFAQGGTSGYLPNTGGNGTITLHRVNNVL